MADNDLRRRVHAGKYAGIAGGAAIPVTKELRKPKKKKKKIKEDVGYTRSGYGKKY